MAGSTKTLGVKFEIAGVKEATAGLNNFRNNLNQSVRRNKQAVNESLKLGDRFNNKLNLTGRNSRISQPAIKPTDSRVSENNIVRLDRRSILEIANLLEDNASGGNRQSDPITEIRKKGLIRGSIASAGNNLRSIYKGFLESIGGGLGTDFGEGLKKALEEDLDFSFKRRGEVTGKTAAFAVSEGGRGLRTELITLFQLFKKTKAETRTPEQAAENANEVRKSLTRLFSLIPTKLATGYRRAAVQLEGLPRVDKLRNRDENKANQFKSTTTDAIYSFGGFAGKKGKAGFENADMLAKYADVNTEIVGMGTQFTDLTVSAKKTTQWVLEALGTVASINVKGFNPDAIKGSAQIINDLDANPDLKATILGHSAGGFPSEEIVQILNLVGYGDRVRGVSAGTPNLKGRLDAPNFTRVMGVGDKVMRNFEQGVDPIGLFADDAEILEGVDGHGFQDYLGSERFLELVFGKRVGSLIERYQKYLEDIAKQASSSAKTKIETLIPDYKNFTLDQKKSTASEFGKNLKIISTKYRQAVKENDLNLARELGENLLEQIQYLRHIYGDILDEGGENRSVSGKLGNLTKIETEIISGQPNLEAQGFDTKGLVNHLGEQLSGEAGFALKDTAPHIVDGFVDGIQAELDRVQEAGAKIGDNLQDGTDENLGIASPAKRYIKKGKEVVQGFVNGVKNKLGDALEAGKDLGEAAVEGTVKSKATEGFESIKGHADSFFDAIGDRFPVLKRFRRILLGIVGLFVAKLGLDFVVGILKKVGGESLEAAMAMESLNLSILFASRNALQGAAALEFIGQSAKQLSIDLISAKDQYSKLLAAARNTSLEGEQINRVFNAFALTASNRGLGAGQQQQVFKALEQIINKRFLGREEVVQQLGDTFSGFEVLLSETLGVTSSQLEKMMKNKEIGLDVLTKIAAALEAQNAAIGSIDTAQKAQTRFNNALLESKVALGEMLQPLQKFVLNLGTKAIEDFRGKLSLLFQLILTTGAVSLISMFGQLNLLSLSTLSLTKSLQALTLALKNLWAAKFAILGAISQLIKAYGLVTAAYLTWKNVIDLSQNQYQSIEDGVDKMRAGIDRYREAIEKANKTSLNEIDSKEKGEFKVGWELPENKFGNFLRPIVGGNYLNLDNLIRNRWNGIIDRMDSYNQVVSGGTAKPVKGRWTSEQERRESDFGAETGDLLSGNDQLLLESTAAFNAAKEIAKLNEDISKIQSEREFLLAGDKEALEESLKKERKISQQIDNKQKILTTFQQEIQNQIAENQNALEQLEIGKTRDGFDRKVYDTKKSEILERQEANEQKLKQVNNEISKLTKTLTLFERKLKNSSLKLTGFIERRQLEASQERGEIITDGIQLSKADRTIQLELDAASRRELQDYISEIEKNLFKNRSRLESAALNDGYQLAQQLAEKEGITLDTAGIDDLLSKNIAQNVKEALSYLKVIRENETKLYQYQEQLAQNIQNSRSTLTDFNRTIDDYFFNINQQIKEAQIEVLRVIDQIIQTGIRNKLTSALSPNADSFVNQLISSTQSLLDQAASYAERVLGQKGARIQFAGQKRSLEYELQDFARNVKGAGDALVEFQQRLNGAASPNLSEKRTSKPEPSINNTLTALRRAIIGKESAGNFKAVNPHSGALGYGQVMPDNVASWTKQALGKSLTANQFLNDAQAQIKTIDYKLNQYLQRELRKGFDIDTAVRRVASTWYSGQPNLYNNTRRQTYGPGSYPSIDSYTADILKRFKAEGSGSIKANPDLLNVPSVPKSSSGNLPPAPPILDRAEKDTNFAISKQEQVLDLQDSLIENQEKETLEISIENNLKSDRRLVDNQITDSQFALTKLLDAGKDLLVQYDFQNAPAQSAKSIRDVNNSFSDRGLEISRQITKYVDEINAINDIISLAPDQSKMLRRAGKDNEADILIEKAAQAQLLLEPYREILDGLVGEYKSNTEIAEAALKYVVEQNKLKEHQEQLNKRSLLVNQQATLAEQRGALEVQRKVKLHQEDLRLALRINELRQQHAPGEYLDSLIKGERLQGQVNTENINYDSQIAELDLEKRLLDYQTGIGDKKAGFMSRFGLNFDGEKLKRENAIAQENLRFERELVELRKQYVDQPEKLAEFSRAATELNRVSLFSIENQFKSLDKTVEDAFVSSTQGFFDQFTTNFFDGQSQRNQEVLQERLRYAEEIAQLEQQYRDEPGKLYHLKSRAKELNEQKLDQISGQFGIFKRVVNLAQQALVEFVKQLAKMAAQQAAAKFLNSILGSVIGGIGGGGISSVGNDFGSSAAGASAFVADEGATVGSVTGDLSSEIKKRKISDRTTNILRRTFPGIANAWSQEGEGARLGVFHVGEELLSRKTGEAGRYQGLKQKYGINPLAKIGVFADGGTVGFDAGSNILAGFDDNRPRIDLSVLSELDSRGRGQAVASRTVNLTQQIFSPSEDSFQLNADQRNQDLLESLQRGFS